MEKHEAILPSNSGHGLSDHSGFRNLGTDYSNSTVPPLLVVVQFNVLKYLPSHRMACIKPFTMNRFYFKTMKKALGASIVVVVAFSTQAACRLVLDQQRLIKG